MFSTALGLDSAMATAVSSMDGYELLVSITAITHCAAVASGSAVVAAETSVVALVVSIQGRPNSGTQGGGDACWPAAPARQASSVNAWTMRLPLSFRLHPLGQAGADPRRLHRRPLGGRRRVAVASANVVMCARLGSPCRELCRGRRFGTTAMHDIWRLLYAESYLLWQGSGRCPVKQR
jgi:hypothetical protein